MADSRTTNAPADCLRCGERHRLPGIKYCGDCRRLVLRRLLRCGYLQPLPRQPVNYRSQVERDRAVERGYGVGWWSGHEEDRPAGRRRDRGRAARHVARLRLRNPKTPRITGRMAAILELLIHDDLKVREINAALAMSQPNASTYLARLRMLGAVERGPRWMGLHYRVTPKGREMFMFRTQSADPNISDSR